ncbi:17S U2 SnRNP complex component HTATSF1-like [Styela clava]
MAMNPETYEEFQRQIELQKEENTLEEGGGAKVKVDEDGTEYEWDEKKKAWFPKLSVELMMKYQENYDAGTEVDSSHKFTSYTDPVTKVTFHFNSETSKWEPEHNENGEPCKYTDPNGVIYVWNSDQGKWDLELSKELNGDSTNKDSNNESTSTNESQNDSKTEHTYTDSNTGILYKWDYEKQLWVSEDGQVMYPSGHGNFTTTSYTDPKTGVIYNWDENKQEWVAEKKVKNKKENTKKDTKRKASDPTWFKVTEDKNTNVYVSGLPPDVSLEEFGSIMSKCGIIMPNPHTGKPKLKLYKDKEGNLKGDGLCCYLKKESLDLAMQLLDDTLVRGGYRIHVQKASFELKGSYDPSKKPKMLSKKEKARLHKEQERLLDWKLARKDAVKKSERVLIFKNMFDPKEFEEDAVLITEIRDDLRKECEKFGDVKKVLVFDRHPQGVCSVSFKDFDEATKCRDAMNERWFAKRKISVDPWDGVTDYQIEETDKEREVRIKNWEKFLVEDNKKENMEEGENSEVKSEAES